MKPNMVTRRLLLALSILAAGACCSTGAGRHGYPEAEYAARLADVRKRAPPGFTTLVVPPFVLAGGTLIEVWLFSGDESYRSHASAIFGHVPETPYGYYAPCDHALIMNVATGYGTLVHEMVHPFIEANFPDCPPWFNEGLASLYEQPSDVGGHLHGGVNWRLAGLQQAILRHRTKPFAELMGLGRRAFYGDDPGVNYAEARYLLYYLQEKGLLLDYYRHFHAAAAGDPTGYRTLQAVLGEPDLRAFQRRWEELILLLVDPRRAG
jgi:hypothetical protein